MDGSKQLGRSNRSYATLRWRSVLIAEDLFVRNSCNLGSLI
jgi:hypothetical protein